MNVHDIIKIYLKSKYFNTLCYFFSFKGILREITLSRSSFQREMYEELQSVHATETCKR